MPSKCHFTNYLYRIYSSRNECRKQKELYITLKEDSKMLDEVVVVGYGSMKKSDLTGAVVSANLKDFEKSPNTNVVQSLQGTVPGLNVGQVTSAGATPSISIRGTNTLSGNKDVLIILDGIIYTSSSPLSIRMILLRLTF